MAVIERWKDRGLDARQGARPPRRGDFADGRAVELYRLYQERLRDPERRRFRRPAAAQPDAVRAPSPTSWRSTSDRFRYILVDEYQDTNVAQYLWLRLLAQGHRNLCCVGDDDQSIYSWRGAEVGNILRFEKDFPGARIVRLEQNYRSTPHILAAASAPDRPQRGPARQDAVDRDATRASSIAVRGAVGRRARRRAGSATRSRRCSARARRWPEIAILVRAGFQTREFEERFITLGLPYRVIGGPRFYERQEIRDALAYLRLIHQPADDLAFERIVNVPRRGIGTATLAGAARAGARRAHAADRGRARSSSAPTS